MNHFERITNDVSIIVKQASKILKDPIVNIENSSNPSTDIDMKISKFLTESLKEIVDVDVLSEEESSVFSETINEEFWLIDPIDGTMNFISGSPDVAISVALVNKDFDAIISVVYLPYYEELYTAIKNQGATLNGTKFINYKPKLDIVAYGLPGDAMNRTERIGNIIAQLVEEKYVLRQSGSAVVDICRVSTGVWSVFFEEGLYVWDIAAANLIALESNCHTYVEVFDDSRKCNYIASNTKNNFTNIKSILGRN